jgi:hypothetical protein
MPADLALLLRAYWYSPTTSMRPGGSARVKSAPPEFGSGTPQRFMEKPRRRNARERPHRRNRPLALEARLGEPERDPRTDPSPDPQLTQARHSTHPSRTGRRSDLDANRHSAVPSNAADR